MKKEVGLVHVGGLGTSISIRAAAFLVAAALGTSFPASGQNLTQSTIYSFLGGTDGMNPWASLIQASDGNLYGTTLISNAFRISALEGTPSESVIYLFTGGSDGGNPYAAVIQASDGALYGTTWVGGTDGCVNRVCGTVFRISNPSTAPTESVIYSFVGGADGLNPRASVFQASDGNLYGTTIAGGSGSCPSGCGTVFKISNPSTAPIETVIHRFAGVGAGDGAFPWAPVIQATDGDLYGTTWAGGSGCSPNGCGTVFKIGNLGGTPVESVIYTFAAGADGVNPEASLIQASDGNLYGTTQSGGGSGCGGAGCGTVFKISNLGGTPTESVVYSFLGGTDGSSPQASLIQASDGNLYGTTQSGGGTGCGGAGCGTVFKISNPMSSPAESVIYSFTGGSDGGSPVASLIQASDGSLYGTTSGVGTSGDGTVFKIAGLPIAARLGYFTLTPCRLIDTRPGSTAPYGGPALAGGSVRSFVTPGFCGVPSGAKAVSANLTAVAPQARGDLRVFPSLNHGSPTSNLNFNLGRTRAGSAIFAIDAAGSFSIQCDMAAGTSTNVLFDVSGYFK
jgi:uncharacterized repeat protein (TIGR03803 family)